MTLEHRSVDRQPNAFRWRARGDERRESAPARAARDHASSVIDLHCHLLPGIDDGPRDMAGTLAMAQLHVAAGVTTVAATPHVSWDMPTEAAAIEDGVAAVRAALAEARIPLEVVRGSEIDVHQAARCSDDELDALTLGSGGWLLLEAPLRQGVALEPVAQSLLARGHGVLIAHPERSPLIQRDPSALQRLARAGAAMQVTAASFTGRFGRTVQRFAEELLEAGLVDVVASDAHDALRRPPGIAEPLREAGIGDLIPLLAQEAPAAILAGESLPGPPRRARSRGLRALLTRR